MRKLKPREEILGEALALTSIVREQSYGDPKLNFATVAKLKTIFWDAFFLASPPTNDAPVAQERNRRLGRNSAHGHAIDLILTNLARIATQPAAQASADRYVDGAGYFALAYEVAERS